MTTDGPETKMPARRTHQERIDLSDKLMLDATRASILECGTRETTLNDVGESAGYSRSLAKARFGSKDHLFLSLAERSLAHWIDALSLHGLGHSGLDALLSRIDAIASYASEYPDDARVLYILWFESVGTPGPLRDALRRFHEQAREDIARLVRAGQQDSTIRADADAEQFSLLFTSVFFGLSYQWIISPNAISLVAFTQAFRQTALDHLAPPAS